EDFENAIKIPEEPVQASEKRRQFIQPLPGQAQVPRNVLAFAAAPPPPAPVAVPVAPAAAVPAAPVVAPAPAVVAPAPAPAPAVVAPAPAPVVVAPLGQCPGGPSLPVECDPKRPWPQCPPQSYCYATNSVDIGPYFCCPIWSTYGAAWRPATPFYNYVPAMPQNWPDVMKLTANWPAAAVGLPVAAAPQPQLNDEPSKEKSAIEASINEWMERQKSLVCLYRMLF
uniref:Cuticle protein n=1 Tax=Syphacia muris TaxID=451379 RepID=A0A0N5AT91_9BILA